MKSMMLEDKARIFRVVEKIPFQLPFGIFAQFVWAIPDLATSLLSVCSYNMSFRLPSGISTRFVWASPTAVGKASYIDSIGDIYSVCMGIPNCCRKGILYRQHWGYLLSLYRHPQLPSE